MKTEDLMILGVAGLVAVGLVWYARRGGSSASVTTEYGATFDSSGKPVRWDPSRGGWVADPFNW